jgi:hypothetical protein
MDRVELKIGEERAFHLPPFAGEWTARVDGMASAVDVRKLWAADPYPEDDEDDEADRPPPDTVFMVRATAPGTATVRFAPGGSGAGQQAREVEITVRM